MDEIFVDFWRDTGKLVNKSFVKFDLQNFCALIISHRTQNNGLNGLSFQRVSPVSYRGAEWIMVLIDTNERTIPDQSQTQKSIRFSLTGETDKYQNILDFPEFHSP
jgi:hypothetical protein